MSAPYPVIQLGDLCDVLDSKRRPITKRDRVEGEYPYYGATGILGYVEGFIFDEPLVLIGEDGAKWGAGANTAFSAEGRYWVNNHAHVIRPHRQQLLDSWLIYQLNQADLSPFITGLTVPKLNQAKMREIPIIVPPLDEQQRIVAVLDKAFAGIATATANAQKNLTNGRALFEHAVQAAFAKSAAQGAWAVHTVETAAAKHRGAVRTGPFGSQLLHSEFVNEGIAVLGIDNAVSNDFRWDKLRFISPKKYEALSRYRVYPRDVIITIMGTCGRCAVIPDDIPLAINTKHLCCITVDLQKCLPEFLHSYFLYHPVAQEYLGRTAKGSIMAGLNMGLIKEMPLHLPAIEEQKRLVAVVAALRGSTESLAVNLEGKLAALTELKQSLLHKAFAGELT